MKLKETDISSKNVFNGKLINVDVNTISLPNGKTAEREVVHHPKVCGAIVINAEKEILLVKQWRDPIHQLSLEIPAGIIDDTDISPQTAMQRELNEEAGFKAEYWEEIATVYTSPGFTDEQLYLFYCDKLTKLPNKRNLDSDEFLNSQWYSLKEIKELITKNKIIDLKTRYAISILENMKRFRLLFN